MKERFEGESNRALLIETLRRQDIVEHDAALAERFANVGQVVSLSPGTEIIGQGDGDNSVYFLLSGEANIYVNGRFVGSRIEGASIGEMSAIDASAPRSATVRAKTEVVALKVPEAGFRSALDADPIAYRAVSIVLAKRLRERSHFYQPPNPRPVLFVGCSVEALWIANELQAGLKFADIEVVVWKDGVFGPGGITFDSLYNQAVRADFAAFVISPDDVVISRKSEQPAPRDNVIFELGLLMGALDRSRVFLIKEHSADVKIPTDLLGVTPVTYVIKGHNRSAALGPVCTELQKAISEKGVR
jgi:CRP/FNR family cyclic AMP-dependent transcriptional regulator